ncbi:MAG: 4Fe-4S cluster-binding domain-containing protein [Chloroflexi bacterium]|nr:4Fe-4S cluster-binding domain-containing protein [Chloroflexota bacterium]
MQSDVTNYKPLTPSNIDMLPQIEALPFDLRQDIKVVSTVFPFRTNRYIVENLIDWARVPHDPIYQLTFPQHGMLSPADYSTMARLIASHAPRAQIKAAARDIQMRHNPHPAGQMVYNVPQLNGVPVPGVQHKYKETVLFFPSQGQTCHAYCSYCFRWAQFIGDQDLRFASKEAEGLARYLAQHPEVTDVLFTGGDPMVMNARRLRQTIEPLLAPRLEHVHTIRIGTKSLAYWPQRYVSDADADDVIRLFEDIIAQDRHLAIMAHFSHPREFETPIARQAIRRLRDIGCEIRMQAPIIHHVNDNVTAWATMWREGVKLGMIPYYMFVSRDTGPKNYFEVPLAEAVHIFRQAYSQVSGLARTVRGPVMSATPGKVHITGTAQIKGQRVFVLRFLQGRNPDWVGRPFFARYDQEATWLFDLEPAFSSEAFFFDANTEYASA